MGVIPLRTSRSTAASTKKRRERLALINDFRATYQLSVIDLMGAEAITARSVKELAESDYDDETIMKAFVVRAIEAQEHTNCLTEVLFHRALIRAKKSEKSGMKGGLSGVPVTFKDTFDIATVDSSIGFSAWCDQPAEVDADLVRIVEEGLGGICFAKTNVPQGLLAFECGNPVFGNTTNPFSSNHTSGGSSGGAAALLAMNGCAVAFGSDMGGSLRIPTHYCGIYALKPSQNRFSFDGNRGVDSGFEAVPVVVGPMTRSIQDLRYVSQQVLDACWEHPDLIHGRSPLPIPWRGEEVDKVQKMKLRIGYYLEDGWCKTSPACARAVQECVKSLTQAGHDVVKIAPPQAERAAKIFIALSTADGYDSIRELLREGCDPREPPMFLPLLTPQLPLWLRWIVVIIIYLLGDATFARCLLIAKRKSARDFMHWSKERQEYEKLWQQSVWLQKDLDGIICPVNPLPALPHGATRELNLIAFATFLYNILDYAVGVIPVTTVDREKDAMDPELRWNPIGNRNFKMLEWKCYGGRNPVYDANTMHGLPVGVQIVGKRWEEEKVIGLMQVVEESLRRCRTDGDSR
ncbi:amidase, partial [Saitoella complicata NRRL Y-17804]|uniref:amidase n=1 Tax=Saitoella complicata (strain BCRC 22490 / CBS 7301 / JCM 7358 / NBRC 10748 / NRRL Y-17804) TaxID=698492 RepID=UPI000866D506